MTKYFPGILISLILLSYSSSAQVTTNLNNNEKEYLQIFNNFKNYVVNAIDKNIDISDTVNLKHILMNYVISDYNLDSTDITHFKKSEIPAESLENFKNEFKDFYQYYFERSKSNVAQHLSAIPLRLSSDKCIYEKLTPFQRENTFVYFDDRTPEKPLGYMLFVPKFKKTITATRIWSWTLMFQWGYWMFKSPMGELGMEYFVSEGVKGPKPENMIGN